MRFFKLFVLGVLSFPVTQTALAIPPPDLILSGLQSVVQVFGVMIAFLVTIFFLLKDTLQLWWQLHRSIIVVLVVITLGVVLGLAAWILNVW
jgi:hypothetical protein